MHCPPYFPIIPSHYDYNFSQAKTMSVKKKNLQQLSLEFTRSLCKDQVKLCLLPAKILLQSICCWPDNDTTYMKAIGWCFFWILFSTEIFHAAYAFKHFTNIHEAVNAGITVTTTLEGLVRLHIMLTKKHVLNAILVKVWKSFWPISCVQPELRKRMRFKTKISVCLTGIFLLCSILCNTFITGVPFVKDHQLILRSFFPFDWERNYVYEILYVCQYYVDWYILFIINAFDFFFVSLLTVCFVQFVILQEAMRNILREETRKHRRVIFGEIGDSMSDKEMLYKCLEQHQLLISICTDMENSFNMAILFQFVVSTSAICAACLLLKVDPSQLIKMLLYSIGHLTQLFYYCYVGQELANESDYLTDAIYGCDWHLTYDRNFRKALNLMIQRSQRTQYLTAAGFADLDFASFLKIIRLSFSFYTLLDSLVTENKEQ